MLDRGDLTCLSHLRSSSTPTAFTESEGCGGAVMDGVGNEDISPLGEAVVRSGSE